MSDISQAQTPNSGFGLVSDPDIPSIISAGTSLTLACRQMIDRVNRDEQTQVAAVLDALHHHLALIGGSLLELSTRLECEEEVKDLMLQARTRVGNLLASEGLSGRA